MLATRESLGEIHRDHSTRLLWNVIRRQPRLVLLGFARIVDGQEAALILSDLLR